MTKKFVNQDAVQKRVNAETQRDETEHRSDVLKHSNVLILEQVDRLQAGASDVGVECAGLGKKHVD